MRKLTAVVALAGLTALSAVAGAALPKYQTSFEAAEGFTAGTYNASSTIQEWQVLSGSVQIVSDGAQQGDQFVTLGTNTQFDRTFSNLSGDNVVWVEGYFRGRGSSVKLGDPQGPVYPPDQASAIVHFSEEVGIQMFDGDGSGGLAEARNTGIALGEANKDNWYKITIRLNFTAKTWDLYVNDAKENDSPLGFRNNNVNSLTGFRNLAQDTADFDAFRIVIPVRGDSNGDAVVDSADIVRLFDFLATTITDPILLADANVNGDGTIDQADVSALMQLIIGAE